MSQPETWIVAWRSDDPTIQRDARFWRVGLRGASTEEIEPEGLPLVLLEKLHPEGWVELLLITYEMIEEWGRSLEPGVEIDGRALPTYKIRLPVERWNGENRDSIYIIMTRILDRASIVDKLETEESRKLPDTDEWKRILVLLGSLREAFDAGDELRLRSLRVKLDSELELLERACFPRVRVRPFNWSKAELLASRCWLLDWKTGY